MAKRLNSESSIGDILKQIIQVNKLQPGIDQVAVKHFQFTFGAISWPLVVRLTWFKVHNHALHALQCMTMYGF